jgi:hypothetical protein
MSWSGIYGSNRPVEQTPEDKLKQVAVNLYRTHSPRIQSILGSPDIPNIEAKISNEVPVAGTAGTTVILNS